MSLLSISSAGFHLPQLTRPLPRSPQLHPNHATAQVITDTPRPEVCEAASPMSPLARSTRLCTTPVSTLTPQPQQAWGSVQKTSFISVLRIINFAFCQFLSDQDIASLLPAGKCFWNRRAELLLGRNAAVNQILRNLIQNCRQNGTKLKVEDEAFTETLNTIGESITALDFHGLRMKRDSIELIERFFPNIKELNLHHCHLRDALLQLLPELNCLEKFDLSGNKKITDTAFKKIQSFSKLKSLNVSGCILISDEAILSLSSEKLKALDLSGCPKITDETLRQLKKFQKLRCLILSRCSGITDEGVLFLANANLKKLDVTDCPHITHEGLKYVTRIPRLHYTVKVSLTSRATIGSSSTKTKAHKPSHRRAAVYLKGGRDVDDLQRGIANLEISKK
ncbi:MAG: hypothetical protein JWO53_46 [Chlamydiia bacterium]|nr:hypothetical protein [Chlamydiia bacterium]